MIYIQSNQKSKGKSTPAYGFLKSQEKNLRTKSLDTFAKCLLFPKRKPYPRGLDLKICRKSIPVT
jgi:hypothetical protein